MRRFLTSLRHHRVIRAPFLVVLFVSLLVGSFILFHTSVVHAQGDFGVAQVDSQIGLSGDSIVVIILRVIRILLGFLGLVLVIMILYAGYTIMTSAGNEEKVERGKVIIRNAVIGTAIILFSFAIVQFVLNILGDATGLTGSGRDTQSTPSRQSFIGVGSLGDVIKDLYPEPNQTEIYRNTKIVITFTDSIDPKTLIEDTNGSGVFGDCTDDGTTKVCDNLKVAAISIIKLDGKNGIQDGEVVTSTIQASYDNDGNVHTVVIKPNILLGSEEEDQWHRVTVTNDISNTDGDSIFNGRPEDEYKWEFETNTDVDLSPPYVVDVSPNPDESVEKNRVLKITFNEPVNPMMVQGTLGADSAFKNIIVSMMPAEEVIAPSGGQGTADTIFKETEIDQFVGGDVSMVSDGEYLYAEDNQTVKKISLENPSNVETFPFSAQGEIHTIKLYQGRLYIVVGRDIVVFNPDTLEQIAVFTNTFSDARDIAFWGTYAYIADGNEIAILDIDATSGTYGEIVFGYPTQSTRIEALNIQGDTLYVLKRTPYGAELDVSTLSGAITDPPLLLGNTVLGTFSRKMVVYNQVAYVIGGDNILRVIDVSDPNTNFPISQISLNQVNSSGAGADEILVGGGRLFIGQYRGVVKVFSVVDDPLEPQYLFSYPSEGTLQVSNTETFSFAYHTDNFFVKYKSTPIIRLDFSDSAREEVTGQRVRTSVDGTWKVTNGYRTVEFVSNEACGINSCGEPIYCLPTLCAPEDKNCTVTYAVLARTASLDDPEGDNFVSAGLFDGVEDIAGNALDSKPIYIGARNSIEPGAHDFKIEEGPDWRHKPPIVEEKVVEPAELASDNYWWFFTVKNKIDNEIPYIEQVSPGIDQPGVGFYDPVQVHFSKEMMSLDNIGLNEYPDSGIGLGYYSRMEDIENGGVTKTQLNLFHPSRAFSPDGKDYWYFPTVPGTVKAVNQFCMYPGRGPDATVPQVGISSPACAVTYSDAGRVLSVSGCMPSDLLVTSSTDTGCISTNHQVSKTQPNTDTCLELLQNDVVSPTQF